MSNEGPIGLTGRNLGGLTETQYHTEYQSIHNQRIALVRIIHTWYATGLPASAVIFSFFYNQSHGEDIVAPIFGVIVLVFVVGICFRFDQAVVGLYPRIIALELMLDYHFYRNYLRKQESDFIQELEQKIESVKTTKDLWDKTEKYFTKRKKFEGFESFGHRGHSLFVVTSMILAVVYIVLWVIKSGWTWCG